MRMGSKEAMKFEERKFIRISKNARWKTGKIKRVLNKEKSLERERLLCE